MKLNIKCWITGFTFNLQARSTRESEIIGREGPVGVGQPGVVRAPSGLIMGLPATATPASKGKPARKSTFFTPNMFFFIIIIICPDSPVVADLQGVSWEGPKDGSRSVSEALTEDEPLYAIPRKDPQPKFTVDDFVLHKMLGKGSFGKVLEMIGSTQQHNANSITRSFVWERIN